MSSLSLPLLPDPYTVSYPPTAADKIPMPVRYFPVPDIMTRAWTTDAHTTGYSIEALPYRLSQQAVTLDHGVVMVLFIADVDCALSHTASGGQGDMPAPDDWWLQELKKLEQLRAAFPGVFIYRTRGGYRLIYLLIVPYIIRSEADANAWKADYLGSIAALRLRFNIYGDPSCSDWQRLYRVPHATRRRGGQPEARETIGSPHLIGVWTCEPTAEEHELAKTLTKKPSKPRQRAEDSRPYADAGNGVLFYAFNARGWIGKEIASGKWAVQCPWQDQHSKGTLFNTSTILYAPGSGDSLGWLHCSHGHCQTRDVRDVLRLFSDEALKEAKKDAGIITTPSRSTHVLPRMFSPWLGRHVRTGVPHAS